MAETSTRVLITGFLPFGGGQENPSALIAKSISASAKIDSLILPVSFQQAFFVFQQQWMQFGPYSHIVMLGQAAGRHTLCVERVALNWNETSAADEDGYLPQTGPILLDAPTALFSDFAIDLPKKINTQVPCQVSLSAGGFVCNNLYYQVLNFLQTQNSKTKAVFVHVPLMPQQVNPSTIPPQPSLPLEQQIRGVEMILKEFCI